jgi:hypothetical protein
MRGRIDRLPANQGDTIMATKSTQSTTATTSTDNQSTQQQAPAPAPITTVANASNHGTKLDNLALYSALVAGMLANYSPDDVFYLAGTAYKRDEAVGEFNGFINAAAATNQAKIDWRNEVAAERSVLSHVRPLRGGMKGIVAARYGKNSPQMIAFGFPATQPKKATVGTKQAAIVKRTATKAARGTNLGKQQKKKIKAVPPPAPAGQGTTDPTAKPVAPPAPVVTAPLVPAVAPVAAAPAPVQSNQSNSNQGNGPTGH